MRDGRFEPLAGLAPPTFLEEGDRDGLHQSGIIRVMQQADGRDLHAQFELGDLEGAFRAGPVDAHVMSTGGARGLTPTPLQVGRCAGRIRLDAAQEFVRRGPGRQGTGFRISRLRE